MSDIELDRKLVTFAQAEGAAPLPQQQRLKEVSMETRSELWAIVYRGLSFHSRQLVGSWNDVLLSWHVTKEFKPIDEYDNHVQIVTAKLKDLLFKGTYIDVFDFLQFALRHRKSPYQLDAAVARVLTQTRAAYRLVGDTFFPVQSEQEAATVERAFSSLSRHRGALQHLKNASAAATSGSWAECVRESVHAVEAISKALASNANTLKPALDELERYHRIHGALKQGFLRIYDFTSDEEGIRHSLLEKDESDVDEQDALFMLGACASFVSYLVGKARAAGINLDQST